MVVHHVLGRGLVLLSALGATFALTACGDDDEKVKKETSATCSSEMFDKYGADAFVMVRDSIVTKALAAPTDQIGDAFQTFAGNATPQEIQNFKDNLAAFLVEVYGGPSSYGGRSMEAAHAGLNITSDQYDYFITEVVVPSLAENGVASDDISDCFAPPVTDADFKASIVGQ